MALALTYNWLLLPCHDITHRAQASEQVLLSISQRAKRLSLIVMYVQTIARGTASLGAINKLGLKRSPPSAMYIGLKGRDVGAVIW